jgi:CAP12/Pycsar effector protein, TIR domain
MLAMKRTIFVGSSHEGNVAALKVCEAIKHLGDPTLDPQLWTGFFDAGSLTFEALEDMLQRCCAAVFVIRRDDVVRHLDPDSHIAPRGKAEYMPRGNVLVEFGLVAGRLGRRNVALCRLAPADLPSDLAGMTIIDMCPKGDCPDSPHTEAFSPEALEKLRQWAGHLLPTASTIERTLVFHGYTGRWEFELALTKWRGMPINAASYSVVNGNFDLFISADGVGSIGSASGTLSCHLAPEEGAQYMSDFHILHAITDIECNERGGIELTSHLAGMHRLSETGSAPAELRAIGAGSEPWTFKWTLSPAESASLEGKVETSASGGTEGKVTARKLRMIR